MTIFKQISQLIIISLFILSGRVLAETEELTSARKLLQAGKTTGVADILKQQPLSAPVLALWGKYHLINGDISPAIAAFESSLAKSDSTTVRIDLGYSYWQKFAENQNLSEKLAGIILPEQLNTLQPKVWQDLAISQWKKALEDRNISQLDRARASIYLAQGDRAYLPLAIRYVEALNSNQVPYLINIYNLTGDRSYLEKALSLPIDARSASWINYKLGRLESALQIAESIPAPDLLWRYQWAMAERSSPEDRLDYLKFAAATVRDFRQSKLPGSSFDLQAEVEPLYKEFAAALLDRGDVETALDAIASLKISQLENFFQDNCFQQESKPVPIPTDTARIQTLVTPKATYIIIERSNSRKTVKISINADTIASYAQELRSKLQQIATNNYLNPASELHRLLIRPILPHISGVKSLVFASDSLLSNFPYSVLYDSERQKFLIEDYAISYSSGLETDSQVKSSLNGSLLVAVSDPPAPWSPLPYTTKEVEAASQFVKSNPKNNLNFVDFKRQLLSEDIGLVHIASHAQIGVNIEQSQIVFADRSVTISELETVLANLPHPLSLLILSGCQTGIGDSRSVLGLAGIALKNNVEQVLASLWMVSDRDTAKLIEEFYANRQTTISEEKALQLAQIDLLKSGQFHPYIWSSLILVKK